MITFITTILFRLFSGVKNAEYYRPNKNGNGPVIIASVEMAIICLFAFVEFTFPLSLLSFLPLIPLTILVLNMFKERTNRVHFYENIIQYTWMLSIIIMGGDLIALFIGSYVGNVIFNAIIQYYRGSTIWKKQVYKKTELIEIGNIKFNKPRISNGYFLTLSGFILGLGYIAFWLFTHYSLTISDVLKSF